MKFRLFLSLFTNIFTVFVFKHLLGLIFFIQKLKICLHTSQFIQFILITFCMEFMLWNFCLGFSRKHLMFLKFRNVFCGSDLVPLERLPVGFSLKILILFNLFILKMCVHIFFQILTKLFELKRFALAIPNNVKICIYS